MHYQTLVAGQLLEQTLELDRSIYRVVELAEGWSSKLAVDEIYFMILEGLMMSLACFVLTVLTPGVAYGRHSHIYVDKSLKATFAKHYNIHEFKSNEKDRSLKLFVLNWINLELILPPQEEEIEEQPTILNLTYIEITFSNNRIKLSQL